MKFAYAKEALYPMYSFKLNYPQIYNLTKCEPYYIKILGKMTEVKKKTDHILFCIIYY